VKADARALFESDESYESEFGHMHPFADQFITVLCAKIVCATDIVVYDQCLGLRLLCLRATVSMRVVCCAGRTRQWRRGVDGVEIHN
jgi:hypothetical protein